MKTIIFSWTFRVLFDAFIKIPETKAGIAITTLLLTQQVDIVSRDVYIYI